MKISRMLSGIDSFRHQSIFREPANWIERTHGRGIISCASVAVYKVTLASAEYGEM
jgi:hypothetical protein